MHHVLIMRPVGDMTIVYRGHVNDSGVNASQWLNVAFSLRTPLAILRLEACDMVAIETIRTVHCQDDEADSITCVVDCIESGYSGSDGKPWTFEVDI